MVGVGNCVELGWVLRWAGCHDRRLHRGPEVDRAGDWAFLKSPKGMVWIFCGRAVCFLGQHHRAALAFQNAAAAHYGLRQNHAIRVKLAAAIVFFAVPGYFLVKVVPDSNLAHHDPKMEIVSLFAVIVA